MDKDLKNKTVVITGAADGIGLEIADQFLKNGAKPVIILDINEDLGKKALEDLSKKYGKETVDFYKCDVKKDLDIISKIIFDKYKTVDVLVNNAGVCNEEKIRETIEINTISVLEWSVKFFEHMRTDKGKKGGTIVNMASVYGFRVDSFLPIYKASKFAVVGFTKSFGHECNFKKHGVRVVAICPGFTRTKLTQFPSEKKYDENDFIKYTRSPECVWQDVDAVGRAAVEVFQKADSGTAWVIEGDLPISQVP